MSPDSEPWRTLLRRRDSRAEQEVARQLRGRPEAERIEALLRLIEPNPLAALVLARRTLGDPRSFLRILDHGLERGDASTIRYWLECVVPPLGIRRVVRHLERVRQVNPRAVQKARYWLPLFADQPGYSPEEVEALGTSTGGGSD